MKSSDLLDLKTEHLQKAVVTFRHFFNQAVHKVKFKKHPKTTQKFQKTNTVAVSVYHKEILGTQRKEEFKQPLSLVFRKSVLKLKARSTHYTEQKLKNWWKQ